MLGEPGALPGTPPTAEAEAARYALLRRLAPSLRHQLVVNLQPIGMIYEVLERRLRAAQPDLSHVHESASKINGFARAALASCLDVVGWLAPDDVVPVGVPEGTRECTALLATSLAFRGFALRNEVTGFEGQVRRSAMRCLFTGALIHCTDHLEPSADLVLTAVPEGSGVLLVVTSQASQEDPGFANEPSYRKLEWCDLEALAVEEGALLHREGNRMEIRLPWVNDGS